MAADGAWRFDVAHHSGYPVTFFPGTTNEVEAQRVTVAAGQTVSDLVMALSPIKVARVEGIVVDAEGKPFAGMLRVQASSGAGYAMTTIGLRPDGTFIFASLSPGDYVFQATANAPSALTATLKLTVDGEDIKDLRIVALPPATLRTHRDDPGLTMPARFSLMASLENQSMPGAPSRPWKTTCRSMTIMPGRNRFFADLPSGWAMRVA